jgi:hypothetical protein
LLKSGDNPDAILNAIDFTAASSSSILVDKLVHFLMGESDGIPKVRLLNDILSLI